MENRLTPSTELHNRAEAVLHEETPENISHLTPVEIWKIVHNLRVHQVELETQNEELRRLQAELDVSWKRYFDFYNLAPVGYCTISENGLILEANLTAVSFLGMTRSELINQPLTNFVHQQDQDIYYLFRKQLIESSEPQACDLRVVRPDGTTLWAHLSATLAQDESGAPLSWMMLSDITEQKQAEMALQESETRFGQLAQQSGTIVWEVDPQGLYTYVSHGVEDAWGYRPEELVGERHFYDLHPEPGREAFKTAAFAVITRKESFKDLENAVQDKDGSIKWVLKNGLPLMDRNGNLLGYRGSDIDITKRKQAETVLHRKQAMLARTESIAQVGSWEWDVATDTVTWSDELFHIFQLDPAERAPSFAEQSELYHPEDMERLKSAVETAVNNGTSYELEFRTLRKDGTTRVCLSRGQAEVDQSGRTIGLAGSLQDITERKRSEEALTYQSDLRERIFNSTGASMAVVNQEGIILEVNENWKQFMRLNGGDEKTCGPGACYFRECSPAAGNMEGAKEAYDGIQQVQNGRLISFEIEYPCDNPRQMCWFLLKVAPLHGRPGMVLITHMDISERKQIFEALKASEERFRRIFNDSRQPLLLVEDDHFIDANQATLDMLGYSSCDELLGTAPEDISPEYQPDGKLSANKAREVHEIAFAQGSHRFEWEHVKKDGSHFFAEVLLTPIRFRDRSIIHVVWTDITERKLAVQRLQESEANFRVLFASMTDLVLVADLDGTLLTCNDAVHQALGYSALELVSMRLLDLFPAKLRLETEQALIAMLAGKTKDSRLSLQAKSGDLIPVVFRVWLNQWNCNKCLFVTCRNLSSEEEAEQRFERLFRRNPALMAVNSIDEGRFIDVNDIWLESLGFVREEVVGKSPHELNLFSDIEKQQQTEKELWQTGRIVNMELQVRCKDGSLRQGLFSGETIRSHGQTFILTVMLDITERKRIEAALEKRMLALLQPLDTAEDIAIEDLFNIDELQLFQDQFASATGVASLITRIDGTPITRPSNFTRLCADIIRQSPIGLANCQRSDALLGKGCVHGTDVRHCFSCGLWDAGAAITVGGRHIANWLIGQVRDASQNEEQMRPYARTIEVDETAFIEAFHEVPAMSLEQFTRIGEALFTLANKLSASAYQNVQQARFISERKQAESQLRVSENRYRELVENANSIILRMDSKGTLSFFNEYAQRFFGFTAEEVLGKNVVGTIVPETDSDGTDLRAMMVELGRHPGRFTTNENENMLRDGTRVWISWTNKPFFNERGEVSEILCVGNDITELKRADEEKRHLQARLNQAQKMEAIGTLAGGIAHDFNNILGAVIGYAELAREESQPGSALAHDLDRVLEAGGRAADLVKQILAFSREASTERVPLQPPNLIKEALKLLRPALPSTIIIKQQLETATSPILADPTQIHQIVMNLCTNAFHAMEQNGGILEISLKDCELSQVDCHVQSGVKPGNFVELSIGDTGQGIAPEIRDKIFEPYFTTKEVGKGTGMGLSIIHGIITAMGGFVTCDSALGIGTTFHVFFPAIKREVVSIIQPVVMTPYGKERILFIDDEEVLAEMGKVMLERLGYKVTVRTSSIEALATFQNQSDQFDAVITDQTMPGMTGIDLARRMLQIRPGIPIILCTGYSNLVSEEQAKLMGIRGFIMKPMSKKEIAKCLRTALDT